MAEQGAVYLLVAFCVVVWVLYAFKRQFANERKMADLEVFLTNGDTYELYAVSRKSVEDFLYALAKYVDDLDDENDIAPNLMFCGSYYSIVLTQEEWAALLFDARNKFHLDAHVLADWPSIYKTGRFWGDKMTTPSSADMEGYMVVTFSNLKRMEHL